MVMGFGEAVECVAAHAGGVKLPETEAVALLDAAGRMLAEAVAADRDQPPFDRSTRDGFALRAAEIGQQLRVIGQVRAGAAWHGAALGSGEAIEIMTGAPMPEGADAVVMVEHVERAGEAVRVSTGRSLAAGENVVPRGSEAREGQIVLPVGVRIGAAEIALAAACGCERLRVFRRPRVAIVATGDELVELREVPETMQIRNSNSYALAAMVTAAGGEAVRLPIARDRREEIAAAMAAARRCELVVLSGGVSMGEYDLVEAVLESMGAEFLFTGVRMQPGKPVVFGRLPETAEDAAVYFFGLPGNPISTQVTFHVFAETMLRALCGAGATGPDFVLARLMQEVAGKHGLTRLLPARRDGSEVRLVGWKGSGDLAANARANCYLELPEGQESFGAGEVVRVLLR